MKQKEEEVIVMDEQYSFSNEGKQGSGVLKNVMKDWACILDKENNAFVWVRKSEIKKFEKSKHSISEN